MEGVSRYYNRFISGHNVVLRSVASYYNAAINGKTEVSDVAWCVVDAPAGRSPVSSSTYPLGSTPRPRRRRTTSRDTSPSTRHVDNQRPLLVSVLIVTIARTRSPLSEPPDGTNVYLGAERRLPNHVVRIVLSWSCQLILIRFPVSEFHFYDRDPCIAPRETSTRWYSRANGVCRVAS